MELLMELLESTWNCMQAYVTAFGLMYVTEY